MGVIGGILLLPFSGPAWCFRLLLERLRDEAEAVRHDEGRGFAELIDLSMRRNAGKISDAEFATQEAELLRRLNSMREYREELLAAEGDMDDSEDVWLDAEPDETEEWLLDAEPVAGEAEC